MINSFLWIQYTMRFWVLVGFLLSFLPLSVFPIKLEPCMNRCPVMTRYLRIKALPVQKLTQIDPVFQRYIRIQHATNPTIQKLIRLDPMDPVFHRYLRIQHSTNPLVRELYRHIRGKIMASFIPESVFQDTVYECAEANQVQATYFVQHLVLQIISHQIADYIHDALT
jgi:hypothetical protein